MQSVSANFSIGRQMGMLLGLIFVPCAHGQLTLTCNPGAGTARVGAAYVMRCAAAGGTAPYTFGLGTGSALPAGLTLTPSPEAMELTGAPVQAGGYTFGVVVQDAASPRRQTTYTFNGTVAPVGGGTVATPPPVITTYAGTDWVFPSATARAIDAPLGELLGVVVDREGNPIIADGKNCIVGRLEKDGGFKVLAGNGVCQGISSGDNGPAEDAALNLPSGLGIAPNGDLYVITAHQIRRISGGTIRTVASYPYLNGEFFPRGNIAIDRNGNLYVPDYWNHRVLKFTPTDSKANSYTMEVYAGVTRTPGTALGRFQYPRGVTLDGAGNLYVTDAWNGRVQKITPGKQFSVEVSGIGNAGAVKIDVAGNLIVAGSCGIYRAAPGNANAEKIGGAGECGYEGDGGDAQQARFGEFPDIATDPFGNIFIADEHRLRKIDKDIKVTTVAGNGKYRLSSDGTSRLDAILNAPTSLAVEPNRPFSLYFGEDLLSHKVRKVADGVVTRVAGTGDVGLWRDGQPGIATPIGTPLGLVFDPSGNLYISDWDRFCYCIRKLTPQGTLTKLTRGDVIGAKGLAMDRVGNIYAAASGWDDTSKVYKVLPNGQVSDFPGGAGSDKLFSTPMATAVDADGNVYVGDVGRVWRVSSNGERSVFAGGGWTDNDGVPATQVAFGEVTGLAFDREGNLYLSTNSNGRSKVKRVTPSGIISTVAGGAPVDQMGDGKIATEASLNDPWGLAFDEAGNLYIADRLNHRIRTVVAKTPVLQVSTSNITFTAPSGGARVTQAVSAFSNEIAGLDFGVAISGGGTWLSVEPGPYATPRLLRLTADPARLPANGVYSALVTITPKAATPASLVIQVVFNVGAARARQLKVSATDVSFAVSQNSTPQTSPLQVSNEGGQVLTYRVSKSPESASWLTADADTYEAVPGAPSTLQVTANPAGYDPGVYAATLTIESDGGTTVVQAVMAVSKLRQTVLLSQTGLSFRAVAGGGLVPPQTVGVINSGESRMEWRASATTTDGGAWLRVSPESGFSDAGAVAPQIKISVNPATMRPGNYYGTVFVTADTSANKTRLLTVFLQVLEAGTPVAAVVQPAELVFRTTPGGGAPGSQVLEVYGINANAKTFRAVRTGGPFQLFPLPGSGTLDPQKATRVLVQPVGEFAAGTHRGEITFQFMDGANGNVQVVKVTVISAAAAPEADAGGTGRGTTVVAEPCTAKNLEVSVSSLAQSFVVSAGWPVGLRVNVFDDCKVPLRKGEGTVVARFDGAGKDEVALTPLGDGTWDGTWVPSTTKRGMQVTISAKRDVIRGERMLGGDAAEETVAPEISKESIVNYYSTSGTATPAISPGGFLSIYAKPSTTPRLADYLETRALPYTTALLGNAQVYFGKQAAPIQFASPERINVLAPLDLPINTPTQVRILRGSAWSLPVDLTVAVARPAVYQLDGKAYAYNAQTSEAVSETSPAKPGDVLTIYVIGLGATAQQLADGSAAPETPPAEVAGVSLEVGTRPATITFAGLTPRWAGLYQINFVVPEGVTGPLVPLTIRNKEQTSTAVNIAVE